jgi:integrase/recombinase XerC
MEGIAAHLEWCAQRGLRPEYLRVLRATLVRITRDVGPLQLATEDQLADWAGHLSVSAGARRTYLAHLSSYYRWLIWTDQRADDPTRRLIRPRLQRRLPRPVDPTHLRRALVLADRPVHTWLLFAAFCGLRAREIAGLEAEHITETGALFVAEGKGGRQRIVPLHPKLWAELEYAPRVGHLFHDSHGRPVTAAQVSQRTNQFLHRNGIPETLHQFRHHYGTAVYRVSHDLRLTQELMGHSDPATTAGYAAWEPDKAAAVVAQLV